MTPHVDRPLVYLAAPYTVPDALEGTNKAIHTGTAIQDSGHVTVYIPHLNLLWALVTGQHDYEYWLSYDMSFLARCDALFRINGESRGADREVEFAEKNHIPVFYDVDELFEWARSREGE